MAVRWKAVDEGASWQAAGRAERSQQSTRTDANVRWANIVGIVAKVAAFFALLAIPVTNDLGGRISPLVVQTGTDITFYLHAAHQMFMSDQSWFEQLYEFFVVERNFSTPAYAPPLFPFLLYVTGYENHTLPLAILYLGVGIATTWIWLRWLAECGLELPWLVLFAVLPNCIWFTLSPSTDLPYAFFFAVFFVSYFRADRTAGQTTLALAAVVLMVLTRSNSLSILLFLLFDLVVNMGRGPAGTERQRKWALLAVVLVTAVTGVYYLPSFNGTFSTLDRLQFFGHTTSDYAAGLFDALPAALNSALSWIALTLAKVLYAVGLRPSFSDVALPFVLLRAVAGIFLLPGLIYLLWRAEWRMRMLVLLFLLPILIGPAQDRYLLPLQALLFAYGAFAYRHLATLRRPQIALPQSRDAKRN